MAHMHLFGEVRGGVVHYHGLRLGQVYTQMLVGQCRLQLFGQGIVINKEVDKAGAGYLYLGHMAGGRQIVDDQLCQLPRRLAGSFGQHHGQVGGQIAVTLILGSVYLNPWRSLFGDQPCCFKVATVCSSKDWICDFIGVLSTLTDKG